MLHHLTRTGNSALRLLVPFPQQYWTFYECRQSKRNTDRPKTAEMFILQTCIKEYTDGSSIEDSYNYISNNHFKPKQTVTSENIHFFLLNRHTRKQSHLTLPLEQHCSGTNSFLIRTIFCSVHHGVHYLNSMPTTETVKLQLE